MWVTDMDIDQLKSNWQQQVSRKTLSENEQLDLKKNMTAIEDKMMVLDKNVKNRTRYGLITFVLVLAFMIVFDYFLYALGVSPLATLGVATWVVCIAAAISRLFMVRKRYDVNDNAFNIEASLEHKLAKVKSETRFYETIALWLLAPMCIGFVLILLGIKATLMASFMEFGFFILCCFWSHNHNKRYVAKNLKPIEDEICSSLESLADKD